MVEGKQYRPINNCPCMRMPPLLLMMTTRVTAMVTEVVGVVVVAMMKTLAVTHTQ